MNEYIKALQELADAITVKTEALCASVDKVQDILNEINKDAELVQEANRQSQLND